MNAELNIKIQQFLENSGKRITRADDDNEHSLSGDIQSVIKFIVMSVYDLQVAVSEMAQDAYEKQEPQQQDTCTPIIPDSEVIKSQSCRIRNLVSENVQLEKDKKRLVDMLHVIVTKSYKPKGFNRDCEVHPELITNAKGLLKELGVIK